MVQNEKIYWPVSENAKGKLVVRGLEEVYSNHTNDEIEQLMKCIDGKNVIEGFISKVDKNGNATEFGVPVLV